MEKQRERTKESGKGKRAVLQWAACGKKKRIKDEKLDRSKKKENERERRYHGKKLMKRREKIKKVKK